MIGSHRRRGTPDSRSTISEHATRQQLIRDRARDLFARHGYRNTTVEDIGRACGIGTSALYHYFSGKEEIRCCSSSCLLPLWPRTSR